MLSKIKDDKYDNLENQAIILEQVVIAIRNTTDTIMNKISASKGKMIRNYYCA